MSKTICGTSEQNQDFLCILLVAMAYWQLWPRSTGPFFPREDPRVDHREELVSWNADLTWLLCSVLMLYFRFVNNVIYSHRVGLYATRI